MGIGSLEGVWIGWECEACREDVAVGGGVGMVLRAKFLSFGLVVEVLKYLGALSNEVLVVVLYDIFDGVLQVLWSV